MTQEAALYQFFNSFGITAYPTTAVPDDVIFPYITYTLQSGDWETSVSLTVNMWTYTASEATANANARLLTDAVPRGGMMLQCDEGALWLRRGTPWCVASNDSTNSSAKLRYFNLTVEYLTTV